MVQNLNVCETDVDIPIDYSLHSYRFTTRWFRHRNQKTWSTFLPDKFDNSLPLRMIQIGVWEGMDLVWCLQHLLNHVDSYVLAIDPWAGMGTKHPQWSMDEIYFRASHNLNRKFWDDRVDIVRSTSQKYLPLLNKPDSFDLAVIDGNHDKSHVFPDAENCFRLVRPGGWLLFDDVRNSNYRRCHVLQGIEKFAKLHQNEVKLVWQHNHCDCYEKIAQ